MQYMILSIQGNGKRTYSDRKQRSDCQGLGLGGGMDRKGTEGTFGDDGGALWLHRVRVLPKENVLIQLYILNGCVLSL